MTLMDKHIMGILRLSEKVKEVNELLSASDFSGEQAKGAGYNEREKKKTYVQKRISHFKQSNEYRDDDYEDSDMEVTVHHYDSDEQSQEFRMMASGCFVCHATPSLHHWN
jgi:ParB-like chromosome segregation protein Spo0J